MLRRADCTDCGRLRCRPTICAFCFPNPCSLGACSLSPFWRPLSAKTAAALAFPRDPFDRQASCCRLRTSLDPSCSTQTLKAEYGCDVLPTRRQSNRRLLGSCCGQRGNSVVRPLWPYLLRCPRCRHRYWLQVRRILRGALHSRLTDGGRTVTNGRGKTVRWRSRWRCRPAA